MPGSNPPPRGPQGPTGSQGPQGIQGPQGVPGEITLAQGDARYAGINVQRPETGGISRTVDVILKDKEIYLADFGALGDGTTADDTPIANAMAALPTRGGVIKCRRGKRYRLTSSVTLTKSVTFQGEGSGYGTGGLTGAGTWAPPTEFVYDGTVGNPVFQLNGPFSGATWRNLGIDCNSKASAAFSLDRWQNGRIEDVSVRLATVEALHMYDAGSTAGEGSRHNVVDNFFTLQCPTVLRLSGNAAHSANSCHNSFRSVHGNSMTDTANAVILEDADNNNFAMLYINNIANGGANYGLELKDRARANYFYQIQAKTIARTPYVSFPANGNVIFGYDRENGQPTPVLETGAHLDWTETGTNNTGWHFNAGHIRGGGAAPTLVKSVGSGTGATHAIVGSDTAGLIRLTTGTVPTASALVAQLVYAKAWPSGTIPICVLTPASDTAAALSGTGNVWADYNNSNNTYAEIRVGSTALAASTLYRWHYHVIGQPG